MNCTNCGTEILNNAAFCPNCGAPTAAQQVAPQYGQPVYQTAPPQAPAYQQPAGPARQLKANRSFIKTLLLSLVTCGIYAIITYGKITDEVNLVCSRYDGKKSMNYYLLFFLIAPITCGIAAIVWMHNICNRIGNELNRRHIAYSFGAKDFWLWGVLGSLIAIGPLVFMHKFFKAVNLMNENYNQFG